MAFAYTPSLAAASIAHLMTLPMDPERRRRGVLMVLIRMLGQTASPERLRQVAEVVPEEATAKRIANPDEATFRGMYLVNAAERRIAGKRSIAQQHSYLRAHVEAATARRRARSALRDAERRWGPLLSWRTAGDSRVTPDCAVLNGKNFYAWSPPGGRPPGAVHPRCRCVSGPPLAGAPVVGIVDYPREA